MKGGATVLAIAQPQASLQAAARNGGSAMSTPPEGRSERSKGGVRAKGLFLLPSIFTAANIAAGYYAISQSIVGGGG